MCQHKQKAIVDHGWNQLNYNLLANKQISPTMTNSDITELWSMLKDNTSTSSTANSTQHNFNIERSADVVVRALIRESDLLEACENNQTSANKGKEQKQK